MSDLFVTLTTFVTGLGVLGGALVVAYGVINSALKRLDKKTDVLHETTVATNAVIEVEKIRNTKIEAKANTAADKVEAVAVQADANRQELMMIRVIMEEWQEDRQTIADLKEELKREKLKKALRWWQRRME